MEGLFTLQILEGNFGLISSELGIRVLCTQMGIHQFNIGTETFYPQQYGVALPRGAPYHHKFSQVLVKRLFYRYTAHSYNAYGIAKESIDAVKLSCCLA